MNIKELFEAKDKLESITKDSFNLRFKFRVLIKHNDSVYTDYIYDLNSLNDRQYKLDIDLELEEMQDSDYGNMYVYDDGRYRMVFAIQQVGT